MNVYSKKDQSYFDQFAAGYFPYSPKDLETMLQSFDPILPQFERPRVCEIGCASGQFSKTLKERYPKIYISLYGLDIALTALSFYPYHKICGDAFSIPVRDASFDIVCLPASLHHLFPLTASIQEISRIIAPKGYLYCVEPNLFHPQRYFFMRFKPIYQMYRKTNDVPIHPKKLEMLFNHFNLKVITCQYVNIYFARPSFLQQLQNTLANCSFLNSSRVKKYIMPWFVLIAKKE